MVTQKLTLRSTEGAAAVLTTNSLRPPLPLYEKGINKWTCHGDILVNIELTYPITKTFFHVVFFLQIPGFRFTIRCCSNRCGKGSKMAISNIFSNQLYEWLLFKKSCSDSNTCTTLRYRCSYYRSTSFYLEGRYKPVTFLEMQELIGIALLAVLTICFTFLVVHFL